MLKPTEINGLKYPRLHVGLWPCYLFEVGERVERDPIWLSQAICGRQIAKCQFREAVEIGDNQKVFLVAATVSNQMPFVSIIVWLQRVKFQMAGHFRIAFALQMRH